MEMSDDNENRPTLTLYVLTSVWSAVSPPLSESSFIKMVTLSQRMCLWWQMSRRPACSWTSTTSRSWNWGNIWTWRRGYASASFSWTAVDYIFPYKQIYNHFWNCFSTLVFSGEWRNIWRKLNSIYLMWRKDYY